MSGLKESGVIRLDANGNGQLRLGPSYYAERWHITSVRVFGVPVIPTPKAKWYRNSIGESSFMGGTSTGTQDVGRTDMILEAGQFLIVVWSDGAATQVGAEVIGERIML